MAVLAGDPRLQQLRQHAPPLQQRTRVNHHHVKALASLRGRRRWGGAGKAAGEWERRLRQFNSVGQGAGKRARGRAARPTGSKQQVVEQQAVKRAVKRAAPTLCAASSVAATTEE